MGILAMGIMAHVITDLRGGRRYTAFTFAPGFSFALAVRFGV